MRSTQINPDQFYLQSYAKVNLHLQVTGKQKNLHTLSMLNVKVTLYDDIFISIHNDVASSCCEVCIPSFPDIDSHNNLITKAFDFFAPHLDRKVKTKVLVKKNIPPGTGLGGGSGNAAVCLKLFNQLWNLYSEAQLLNIALKIGSDVPFFLYHSPSFVKGLGEIVEPVNFNVPVLWFVLVIPSFFCSTKRVFEHYDTLHKVIRSPLRPIHNFSDLLPLKNDLLCSSIELYPELSMLLDQIKNTFPMGYNMSGSGSSCFGIYETFTEAYHAKEKLSSLYKRVYVVEMKP